MAFEEAAPGPSSLISRAAARTAAIATRNVRTTVILSLVMICGSFAAAGVIQLRLDRGRALDQARQFETRRAAEMASDLSVELDRYAALGTAFANATGSAEASAALSDAGGKALRNIALLDNSGNVLSQMKGAPRGLLPLSDAVLADAAAGRVVVPGTDGESFALLFALGKRIVAVQIDPDALLHPARMRSGVLATRSGTLLELGANWNAPPAMDALALGDSDHEARFIGDGADRRLVALHVVPGWPVVTGASIRTGKALMAWYASLPLFAFFIIGPALAGAGLAVVFVREFERRARASDRLRSLRGTQRSDARLLIRLADAERRATEAERSKSEFVAHMSHELRTPLNAIIGFSEVIAQGYFGDPGHPKYVEYASDIGSAGRHLHAKIGDVLDFANLEAGRHPVDRAAVDISAVARQVVDELAGRAFSRRIRMTVSLADCAPAIADSLGVKRILTNLMINALQFTPEGGAVRVSVRSEEGAIVASISDSGLGFTREEQDDAGKPFTRFDRPGAVTGVGMGLAVAMVLARQMGGALRLAGAPGQGTTAELRLPKA